MNKYEWYKENEKEIKRLDELKKDIDRISGYRQDAIMCYDGRDLDVSFMINGSFQFGLFTEEENDRILDFIIAMKKEEIRYIENKIN